MSKRGAEANRAARVVRDQLAKEQRQRRNRWITVGAIVLLVVAGLIGYYVYQSQQTSTVGTAPAHTINVGGDKAGLVVAGDGPVTVEVYLDFICPVCKNFEATVTPTLDQLVAQHKITLVWHPLNFLDPNSTTRYSTRAASSAGCASDAPADKTKAYGQALFASQPAEGSAGLTDDQLIEIAGNAGINTPEFAQCVRAVKYADWVNQVTADALQHGVQGTPTVVVGGKVVTNPTAANVQAAVAAAS